MKGTVRFIGHTLFAPGIWVGVELSTPDGKNNGSVQGHYYFQCPMNYGLFIREDHVEELKEANKPSSSSSLAGSRSLSQSGSLRRSGALNSETMSVNSNTSDTNLSATSTNNNSVSNTSQVKTPHSTVSSTQFSHSHLPVTTHNTAHNASTTSLQSLSSNASVSASVTTSSLAPTDKKVVKSSSVLKVKLSKIMELLNRQLEMVEELEREEKINPSSAKVYEIRNNITVITNYEVEAIDTFNKKWREFPSST